jgi:hypothetical protein
MFMLVELPKGWASADSLFNVGEPELSPIHNGRRSTSDLIDKLFMSLPVSRWYLFVIEFSLINSNETSGYLPGQRCLIFLALQSKHHTSMLCVCFVSKLGLDFLHASSLRATSISAQCDLNVA